MKLRLLSDLHTEGCSFHYERLDEDILILAGDIGVAQQAVNWIKALPKDLEIIYVPGNHEYYKHNFEKVNSLFETEFEDTNITLLNNRVLVYKNVRFIGTTLFSDFGLYGEVEKIRAEFDSKRGINDFRFIYTGEGEQESFWSVQNCKDQFYKSEQFLKEVLKIPFEGKTVVITHFCPSEQSVHQRFKTSSITPFFASNCEHLMGFSDLWLHGHTHDSFEYEIKGTKVVCNPRGYGSENKLGFNPNLIINI